MYSNDLQFKIANYYSKTNKSLRVIALDLEVSKSSVHRWYIKYFINKKSANEKTKVFKNIEILHFLKRSLNHNPYQTLEILKMKIFKKYKIKVSISTVSNYLQIIGYSKKKITKRFYNKCKTNQLLKRKDFLKKVRKINREDIICIDETAINRNTYMNYGWCKKNKRLIANIPINKLPKKYSIIMAISLNGILYYEIHKKKAINCELFDSFMNKVLKKIKNKYILMDNIPFHKSKNIIKKIESNKCKPLFIPPYSPDFNPIEEVFSSMKHYVKKQINPISIDTNIEKHIKNYSKNNINFGNYYKHSFG
jgi:transposase